MLSPVTTHPALTPHLQHRDFIVSVWLPQVFLSGGIPSVCLCVYLSVELQKGYVE